MGKRSALGVDLGTHAVQVAQVVARGGDHQVANFGGLGLPAGAVREGEVVDSEAVAEAIRSIVSAAGIREKNVVVGVSNQRVVVRQVELPWMEEAELRASLQFQVQEYIPIPVEDAELDFHVLEEFETDNGTRMLRILLVAAQRDMVAGHLDAVVRAGLRPVAVDLNPFAVIRSVGDYLDDTEDEVLIDIGAGVTNIVVHHEGVPRFVRILVAGGEEITQALETGQGLSRDEAEAAKTQADLQAGDGDMTTRIVEDKAREFLDDIRSSLDYYQTQPGSRPPSRVKLTGGGALLGGLAERMAEVLRLPVEIVSPLDRLNVATTALDQDQLGAVGPTLATAVGLGLGGVE